MEGEVATLRNAQRQSANKELIEDDAKRIDIRPGVDRLRSKGRLFGAHVFGRSDRPMDRKYRFLGQVLGDCLGDAEVDDFGDRLSIDLCGQDVRGLQIAVDHGLLVSVLHAAAYLHKELQSLAYGEPMIVAVERDRHAGDILHYEIRQAFRGRAGVEHFGDGGMVHEREGLPL